MIVMHFSKHVCVIVAEGGSAGGDDHNNDLVSFLRPAPFDDFY